MKSNVNEISHSYFKCFTIPRPPVIHGHGHGRRRSPRQRPQASSSTATGVVIVHGRGNGCRLQRPRQPGLPLSTVTVRRPIHDVELPHVRGDDGAPGAVAGPGRTAAPPTPTGADQALQVRQPLAVPEERGLSRLRRQVRPDFAARSATKFLGMRSSAVYPSRTAAPLDGRRHTIPVTGLPSRERQ